MPKHMQTASKPKNTKKAALDLIQHCKPFWGALIAALLCILASTVLSVLAPRYIGSLTDLIKEGILPTGVAIDMQAYMNTVYLLIGLYAAGAVLNYAQGFIMTTVSCRMTQSLRSDISKKINKIPLRYYDSHNFGDTLSRVTNDVDTISQSFTNSIATIVSAFSTLIGCLVMMFVTQWIMAFAAIGATILGFVLIFAVMARSQKYFRARQQSLASVNGHVEEYYAGQNIVRAYNAEADARADFRKRNDALRLNTFKAEFLGGLMHPLMAFIGNFGYIIVVVVGAALVFTPSYGVGFGVITSFMIYVRQFTSPLSQIAQGMTSMQSAASASERVFEFLREQELSDESGKRRAVQTVKGDVAFSNVRFGYDENKIIIRNFSAQVKAGQKVAIVGPTGAGKTTIVNLLMRFYDLNGGSISIDGVPTESITRENVHDLFGMVLQDTWLFEGTLRDNLTYGKSEVSDERLWEIIEKTGLTHYVRTVPQGLDTVLNGAVAISAGQKQLITIARAMVENAPMLILDEATSSVDTRTELQIQKAIDALTAGRPSFVIAHRLSTIRDADMILYMQDGDVRETGTHEELLKKNGLYAKMYNSQFDVA